MTLTMKNATANPIAATATMPAPTPPTIAPVLTPELEPTEVDEALGTADDENVRLSVVSRVTVAGSMTLLGLLMTELVVGI